MHRDSIIRILVAAVITVGMAICATSSSGLDPVVERIADDAASDTKSTTEIQSAAEKFVGVGACSASNCHGGDGSDGLAGSEYSVWIQEDEHAQAYSVLFDETSQRMARLLNLDRPAHQAKLCLNCHAPQSARPVDDRPAVHGSLLDGVSCEACHGAASNWLGPHVRFDWNQKTAAEKRTLGFLDTKSLPVRGRVCADCHVGAPDRDVNHDLYAAGHPRLFFELSAFNANLPAHWDRNDDRRRAPLTDGGSGFEAKLWAVGQLASAEAGLDLLIHRAKRAADETLATSGDRRYPSRATLPVWPELAETGCFACHHDLSQPSWRQGRGYASRRPGSSPWGTWLFPMVPKMAESLAGEALDQEMGPLELLSSEMSRPYPRVGRVVDLAEQTRVQLLEVMSEIDSRSYSRADLRSFMIESATDEARALNNWDSATQTYLGLVAIHQTLKVSAENGVGQPTEAERRISWSLEEIRGQLEFRPGSDSPSTFGAGPVESIARELDSIREALQEPSN